jgi:hypothetical protein
MDSSTMKTDGIASVEETEIVATGQALEQGEA